MPLGTFRLNTLSRSIGPIGDKFEIWAWGNNDFGKTGFDTTTGDTPTPTQVGTATNWSQVSAGITHSLAITTTGELWAWGNNAIGRTGLGTTTGNTPTPTRVGTASNWSQVSAGNSHSLAITTTGELWAWGSNTSGRTGLGTTTGNTPTPTRVGTASNWSQVSAGFTVSLAINTDGELYSWGLNANGTTGLGTTTGDTPTPTRVGTASNWSQVSAGFAHVLAITTTGELWAWGFNADGRLGDGTTTQKTSPVRIGTATNWGQVSAGNHSLAITTTGELWAWGNNADGRLGDGTTTQKTSPVRIGTATNWGQVSAGTNASSSAGNSHSLAITTTGELYAWGNNANGQLGLGDTTQRTSPTRVGTASNWASVNAGNNHSLAIRT